MRCLNMYFHVWHSVLWLQSDVLRSETFFLSYLHTAFSTSLFPVAPGCNIGDYVYRCMCLYCFYDKQSVSVAKTTNVWMASNVDLVLAFSIYDIGFFVWILMGSIYKISHKAETCACLMIGLYFRPLKWIIWQLH